MRTKTVDVEVKATDEAEGRVTFYASVFGNVDSYGDMVVKGAFEETLAEYDAAGAPVPVYWRHGMHDPMLNVGGSTCQEDERGLLVDAVIDQSTPTGAQVFKLLKEKRVRQASFAYDVLEGSWITGEDGGYYELRKLRLHEVSIVPVGANQATEILTVKSAVDAVVTDMASGTPVSVDDRKELLLAAKALAAALGAEVQNDDHADSQAKDEEPHAAKSEELREDAASTALAINQLIQTL